MKFGLIGCGAIGEFRAASLQKTPGAKLEMVFDELPERSENFARKYSVRSAADFKQMLENREIDAVIVSTPPNLHAEHCIKALRAGKHVLCEKPLASTVEDCRRIVAAAEECGKILATGYNYRFYPAIVKAREIIDAGKIGEIVSVKSFAGHPGGPEFTHQWVHDPNVMGGGALMDNGIHLADLMLYFLGEKVTEARGFASDRTWNFGASEDNGFVLAQTASGKIGSLHASWSEWKGYHFFVEIGGTGGSIRVQYPPMMTVHYRRPEGTEKKGVRRTHLFPMMQIKERMRSYRWTLAQSFIAEQTDFICRVRGDETTSGATGIDGLQAVELVNAAYRQKTDEKKQPLVEKEINRPAAEKESISFAVNSL